MAHLLRLLTAGSLTMTLVAPVAATGPAAAAVVAGTQVTELALTGVDPDALPDLPSRAPLPPEDVAALGVAEEPGATADDALPAAPDDADGAPSAGSADDTVDGPTSEPTEPGVPTDEPDEPSGEPTAGPDEPTARPTAEARSRSAAPRTAEPAPGWSEDPTTDPVGDPDVLTDTMDVRPFSVLGVTWDLTPGLDEVVVRYRVRQDGQWSTWQAVGASDVAPDADRDEGSSPTRGASDPVVAVGADGLQVWADAEQGAVTGLKVVLVDPGPEPTATGAALSAAVAAPGLVTRAQWGADESMVTCAPDYSREVRAAAVHHTATTNAYSPDDVPGILRGILAYHTRPEGGGGRGWCDIGYNFLVDKWGRVFEGRSGGVDRPVVGVHTGGFNSRTIGIAAIGEYGSAAAPVELTEAISRLVAWKFALHRIGSGNVTLVSGGGASKFPAGTAVTFPTVFGHRDAQYTTCPGQTLYTALDSIRARVAALADATVAASPFGVWESVKPTSDAVTVRGWAAEPGSTASISVRVQVGGVTRTVVADRSRPDVPRVHPGQGQRHGFEVTVPVAQGRHAVCVTALNVGAGQDVNLGCTWARVRNSEPVGGLEAITATPAGVSVAGWAFDRDADDPIQVHVHVDGRPVKALRANLPRPDVARVHDVDERTGFSGSVGVAQGRHEVCVYLINVPTGPNPRLGCRTVQVGNLPQGSLDAVTASATGVSVRGWAFDRDTSDPIQVHVYVDGRAVRALTANGSRPDVARVHGVGERTGFSGTVATAPGRHEVCVWMINAPTGTNPLLACRTVEVVNRSPQGALDAVTPTATGVSVRGWAFDRDSTDPLQVHVYVDGRAVRALTANGSRPDVARVHGVGERTGFSGTVATGRGRHEVCVWMINRPAGPNPQLACRTVDVP